MKYIDYFIDSRKPLMRPRPVVVEADFELVCDVFPEPGFRSFFYGYIISKLANDLRKNGITNYIDRESRPDFPSITRFLSNIVLIGEETFANERRGAGSAYEADQSGEGKSPDTQVTPSSQVKGGKGKGGINSEET